MRPHLALIIIVSSTSANAGTMPEADWRLLARESVVVVAGTMLENSFVEWPEATDPEIVVGEDGSTRVTQVVGSGVLGTVALFRVDEILTGSAAGMGIGAQVEVFVNRGGFSFESGRSYLLFLTRPLVLNSAASNPADGWMRLYGSVRRRAHETEVSPFDPAPVYGLSATNSVSSAQPVLPLGEPAFEDVAAMARRQAVNARDSVPPRVQLTEPARERIVGGTIQLSARATDGETGIEFVDFTVDGSRLPLRRAISPYATTWDTHYRPDGPHVIGAVASDVAGNAATASGVLITIDNTAPALAVSVFPELLTPNDGTMRDVELTVAVTDETDPSPSVRLVSITSNEPIEPGDVMDAVFGTDDRRFQLRARANGLPDEPASARAYRISLEASDALGNSRASTVTVTVPR